MDLNGWPGIERRRPSYRSPTYAVRAPLARWLQTEAIRAAADFGRFRVLDVGCGPKPYYPFFAPLVAGYAGLDLDNPAADILGPAEAIPIADHSFEVVLCTQLLEHSPDPAAVVRELARVVAPGGRVLASTHGVSTYHPDPIDRWRWTHEGLEHLFTDNGDWRSLKVEGGSGTASCLGMLLSFYLGILCRQAHVGTVGAGLTYAINRTAEFVDLRLPIMRTPGPGSLVANYHVTAEAL